MLATALAFLMVVTAEGEPVRLRPGGQSVLKVPGLTRVAIGEKDVADVRVTGAGELLLLGRHAGRTTITLWAQGRVATRTLIVDDGATDELARLVHDLVNPTLKVQSFEDRIVIDGTVDSLEELHRLERLVGEDPRVKILVQLDATAIRALAETITQALHRSGLPEAHATAVGQRILLEGAVSDGAEREKAQDIADAYWAGYLHTAR
jgi:Flp pilus assembly secretin CpaC